ncbi:MAG TPA: serine hydrolase domain-containing protein [Nostocaceae cyanobacterium]|nr:serine hydrolase domain-containing protein [Nostocaceae cyanobacterium]
MSEYLKEQLKLAVENFLSKSQIPGAAVAVYVNSQAFLELGIGYQNLSHTVLLPTDANFYIYSITKSLLATVSLYLVNQGLLTLDTSLQPYTPFLDTPITLRQLLSHTSGLPEYGELPIYFASVKANPASPWSTQEFLEIIQKQGLQFPPGQGWKYSNIGYLVLRCVLEKITGLSIQQLLEKVIFNPLGLQKTFLPQSLDDVYQLTPGYSNFFHQDELQDISQIYHPGWVAHSVVISTAPELAKIIDALFTGKIIPPDLVEQMLSPVHIFGEYPPLKLAGYGLGLALDVESPYGKMGGHNGGGPGYSTAAFHFSKLANSRVTVVALLNRDKHDHGLLLVDKIAQVFQEFVVDGLG